MTNTITNQTIQVCIQLENYMTELYWKTEELEDAMNGLRGLTGMDEPIARLKSQRSNMDYQYTVLRQMTQALNNVILDYTSCENRICDYGEQNVIAYARREIGINDLSNISNILNGL